MSSFNQVVEEKVYPRLEALCNRYYEERSEMLLDGYVAFPKGEAFLPGTIVSSFCYVLLGKKKDTEAFERYLLKVRELVEEHSRLTMNTFGILEFLSGLYVLKENDILEKVITREVEEHLREKLHWNVFYDMQSELLKGGMPTNYYGVAYRVALLREELGWEHEGRSTYFLEKLTDHVKHFSGNTYYMDETSGEGRYDKYTISIASEICEAHLMIGREIPNFWRQMMMKMTDIVLNLADEPGMGFTYGRSIGAHGAACIIESVPIALYIKCVEDESFAYSYLVRAARLITEHWYSKKRDIITLWDEGRRTDHYRNKHRVLEVNLDMNLKLIRANDLLQRMGMHTQEEVEDCMYKEKLCKLPKLSLYANTI